MESFRSAGRVGMLHGIRSLLKRSGIEDLLGQVAVPTLVISVREDVMGWRPTRPRPRAPRSQIVASRRSSAPGTSHHCSSTTTASDSSSPNSGKPPFRLRSATGVRTFEGPPMLSARASPCPDLPANCCSSRTARRRVDEQQSGDARNDHERRQGRSVRTPA